ncbi:MAG: DUF4339 domain-containing protein [Bacteroidales bacterium]|jgi:glycosyltransferase involved in cell wall biosynthesis|nr:DUF4339 domain-containing protein [Bacteroidales bacterium]
MRKYFYTDGESKFGPFSKDELKSQKITRSTKVWYFGLEQWTEINKINELNDIFVAIPPELKPLNPPITNKIEVPENKHLEKPISVQLKTKKSKLSKWIIGIAILIVTSFVIIILVQKQSEANLYKEIVTNSYNADENFDIYVEKFYRDLEFYGIFPKKPKSTIIKFSRLDQLDNTTHIHGLSLGYNDDSRIEIYINPSTWQQFTKPMRYFLMYHELAHDVLNLDDLDNKPINEGKLMYPEMSSYEKKNMDDFIESFHTLFEEQAKK